MNKFKMKSRVVVRHLSSGEVIIRNAPPRRDNRVRLSQHAQLIIFVLFSFVIGIACGIYLTSATVSPMFTQLAK